jgi:hypothetical protein
MHGFVLPFHVAEQRSKKQESDSAEHPAGVRLSEVARFL